MLENAPGIATDVKELLISNQKKLEANKRILEAQIRQKKQTLVELNSKSRQISRSHKLLQEELEMSFDIVKDASHWKNPIDVTVAVKTASELDCIVHAIIHFTASVPVLTHIYGCVYRVKSEGYYKAVGA